MNKKNENMRNTLNTRNKIISAAMKEFSLNGLKGSRVENITKRANVNKAMLFYYFGSKQKLYEIIIQKTVGSLLKTIGEIIHPELTIEEFIEEFPSLYIDHFSKNKSVINMLAIDIIQNPNYISNLIGTVFRDNFNMDSSISPFERLIKKWSEEDKITEKNPVHFMLNIMSLIIFPFIMKPIPEAVFNKKIDDSKEYYEHRKESIKNLLKRGLLK